MIVRALLIIAGIVLLIAAVAPGSSRVPELRLRLIAAGLTLAVVAELFGTGFTVGP
jgi:hypothetical protein